MANGKSTHPLVLAGAGGVALGFALLMYQMNANVARMAGHVGAMAGDMAAMRVHIETMSTEMAAMRASMQAMGGAAERGGKLIEQWDPTRMLRQ